MFKKIIIIVALVATSGVHGFGKIEEKGPNGCELTEEYKRARWEFQKPIRENWHECENSISQANYWYAFSQCLKEQESQSELTVMCGRDAAHNSQNYEKVPINSEHCSRFRVDYVLSVRELEKEIERLGITKCK